MNLKQNLSLGRPLGPRGAISSWSQAANPGPPSSYRWPPPPASVAFTFPDTSHGLLDSRDHPRRPSLPGANLAATFTQGSSLFHLLLLANFPRIPWLLSPARVSPGCARREGRPGGLLAQPAGWARSAGVRPHPFLSLGPEGRAPPLREDPELPATRRCP